MLKLFSIIFLGLTLNIILADTDIISFEKLWETEADLKIPESVCYNSKDNVLYVANINGRSNELDDNGFISRISLEGDIVDLKWITGLNAPKGMVIYKDRLYVTDILDLVIIDIEKNKISSRIPAPDAEFLNDITVDEMGIIFITDMRSNIIYRYKDNNMEKWFLEVDQPNGIFYENNKLHIGNSGTGEIFELDLQTISITRKIEIGSGIDGLKRFASNSYLTSDWSGRTALIDEKGILHTILDTSSENVNAADLEYIPKKRMLLIPTFFNNRVIAYKLETD